MNSPIRKLLGCGICLAALSLWPSARAGDPRFDSAWGRCSHEIPASPAERKSACDIVIGAGKSGGGSKLVGSMTRGELLYTLAFACRAKAYIELGDYETG